MTTLEVVFLVLGLACLTGCVLSVRRALIVIRLVMRGERTEGWCVRRSYHRDGRTYNHPEFTFAFRTPDGETVEFKDRPGAFGYEEGAPVRVCYDPARARVSGHHRGARHLGAGVCADPDLRAVVAAVHAAVRPGPALGLDLGGSGVL